MGWYFVAGVIPVSGHHNFAELMLYRWVARIAVIVFVAQSVLAPAASVAAEIDYAGTSSMDNAYFEDFNRSMFEWERYLAAQWSDWFAGEGGNFGLPDLVSEGINNAIKNLISEPLTFVSSVIALDAQHAFLSANRLLLNSTIGLGGFIDVASYLGLEEKHRDLGLALCVHGVPGGPFLFLPLIGPRTLRDFIMDYVVAYTLYVYIATLLVGRSAPIILIVLAKNALWLAEIATSRTMDYSAAAAAALKVDEGYDAVKEEYLRQRHYRCQALDAAIDRQWDGNGRW